MKELTFLAVGFALGALWMRGRKTNDSLQNQINDLKRKQEGN